VENFSWCQLSSQLSEEQKFSRENFRGFLKIRENHKSFLTVKLLSFTVKALVASTSNIPFVSSSLKLPSWHEQLLKVDLHTVTKNQQHTKYHY